MVARMGLISNRMPRAASPATDRVESCDGIGAAGRWSARSVAVDGAEWTELLGRGHRMLFHEPVWAHVTERGFGGEACAVVFEKDGAIRGGVLGFAFRSLWARFLYFSFPYGGVVGEAPPAPELGRLLREIGGRLGVTRIRLTDCPGLPAIDVDGFEPVDMHTQILELTGDYEALWTGFKARVRRDVRKAERAGVTVAEATSEGDVAAFYELYLHSMRRNATVAKYGIELVQAIHRDLGRLGRSAFLLARREGKAIAGVLVVDSDSMSHYLMGGSLSEELQHCPNDLLLDRAIRRAVEKGKAGFDFLPSGVGDEALERFKAKWGSLRQPIRVHTAITRPALMATWDAAYRLADNRLASSLLQALRRRRGA
jgi:hypothetical protein